MNHAKPVHDERKVVGTETLACKDPDEAPFALLKIPEALLRLVLHLEDRFGDAVEHLPCIRKDHFSAKTVEKLDFVVFLKTLDPLRDGRLGDEHGFRRRAQTSMLCSLVEDLQLIEIHYFVLSILRYIGSSRFMSCL